MWRTRPLSAFLPTSSSVLSFAAASPQSPSHIIHPLPPPPPPPPDGRSADALRICHANNEALNHVASRLDRLRGTDGRTDGQAKCNATAAGQWRHAVTRRAALFQRAFSREASRASGGTDGRTDGPADDGRRVKHPCKVNSVAEWKTTGLAPPPHDVLQKQVHTHALAETTCSTFVVRHSRGLFLGYLLSNTKVKESSFIWPASQLAA